MLILHFSWWSISMFSFINIAFLLVKEKGTGVETTQPFSVTEPLKPPTFMELRARPKLPLQLQVFS